MADASITSYLAYLSETRHLLLHTIKAYRADLGDYERFMNQISLISRTHSIIDRFIRDLRKRGLLPSTINRKLAAISGYHTYLVEIKKAKDNPARGFKRQPNAPFDYQTLTLDDVNSVLAASEAHPRTAMIVRMLLADFPMKVICNTTVDADFPMAPPGLLLAIENYKQWRTLHTPSCNTLLISKAGKKLSGRSVRRNLDKIMRKADLVVVRSPSALRHTGKQLIIPGL